jgi:type II secretory pathway component PulC
LSKGCGQFCGLEVYFIPDATANLISEGKLISDGYRIVTDVENGKKTVYAPGEEIMNAKGKIVKVIDSDQVVFKADYCDNMMTITYYMGEKINTKSFWTQAKSSQVLKNTVTKQKAMMKTGKKKEKKCSNEWDNFEADLLAAFEPYLNGQED